MKPLSSLTNRLFLASALLAVVSIGTAIAIVNLRVTKQAEGELQRGLEEAGRIVDQYQETRLESSIRMAHLVADLPRLKAAVDLADPPTVQPLAQDYLKQVGSALFTITHRSGKVLASAGDVDAPAAARADAAGIREALAGREATTFWPASTGILQVVTVPIFIGENPPEILGALSVGFALDDPLAGRFKALTGSEIAFALDGQVQAATLPRAQFRQLEGLLGDPGISRLRLEGSDYLALARPLAPSIGTAGPRAAAPGPAVIILKSRMELLRFLGSLHAALGTTAVIAVALATMLSYGLARTVTRPLRAITATMREMATTGDLALRTRLPGPGRWHDEDALLLGSTFNAMTEAIARFQREAAQRERLASLGRLSTVLAHEIRNPLMIIKAAVRTLRQEGASDEERLEALGDIDEEVARLNHLVDDVLDFARPIRFEYALADVNEICRAAAGAAMAGGTQREACLKLDAELPPVMIDAERLHGALVNVLTNARHALAARSQDAHLPDGTEPDIQIATLRNPTGRIAIVVRDRGAGIAAEDLPHVWEPYFTTKRGGTGLGLAIVKNVVEGLGGSITIESRAAWGTEVRIELPERPPEAPSGAAHTEERG